MSEHDYERGSRAAWQRMLSECLRNLGTDGDGARWVAEREDTIAQLRILCEEFGDNEWGEDLHLADVIEKHLARHLLAPDSKPLA